MKKITVTMLLIFGFFTTTQAQWQSNSSTIYSNAENIGIGTASPQSKLHVASDAPIIRLQNTNYEDTDGAFYGWLGGYDKSGDEIWWLGEGSSSGKMLGLYTNRPGYDLNIFNNGKGVTVRGDGTVGIGTSAPAATLDVRGSFMINGHLAYLPWYNLGQAGGVSWNKGHVKLITPIGEQEGNMFSIKIKGYKYGDGGKAVEIRAGGYAYSAGGLISTDIHTEGTDLAVGMGVENGKVVIYLGDGATETWYYDHFTAEYSGWNIKHPGGFQWQFVAGAPPAHIQNQNLVYADDSEGTLEVRTKSGATAFLVNSNGQVGIGTSNPSNEQDWGRVLDVRGDSHTKILATNSDASYKTGLFTHTNWYGGGGFVGTESNHNLHLLTGYTPRVSILSNGNVGIGTTDPSNVQDWGRVLDLRGHSHAKMLITNQDTSYKTGMFMHTSWYGGGGFAGTESNHNFHLVTGYTPRVSILSNGNVGIGTTDPSNTQGWGRVMDLRGHSHAKMLITNSDASYKTGLFTHTNWYGGGGFAGTESNHNFHLVTGYTPRLSILTNGNVGIGTTNPQAMLAVNGPIHAKEIKVMTSGWSDFVFEKDYELPSLEEVENHIKEKGHLPDIPSEAEVMKDGITLGEMNSKLLQKIEELTLYMIEQNKRHEILRREVGVLKQENKALKDAMDIR